MWRPKPSWGKKQKNKHPPKPQTKQAKKLSKDQRPWKSQRREHRNNIDGWPERLSEKNGPIIHLAHVLTNTPEAPPYYKMKDNSSFLTSIFYIEEGNSCGGFVTQKNWFLQAEGRFHLASLQGVRYSCRYLLIKPFCVPYHRKKETMSK